jgi:hypothetical protein
MNKKAQTIGNVRIAMRRPNGPNGIGHYHKRHNTVQNAPQNMLCYPQGIDVVVAH